MLNFIAMDLQLYHIFKITRVSFFSDTVYFINKIVSNAITLSCSTVGLYTGLPVAALAMGAKGFKPPPPDFCVK